MPDLSTLDSPRSSPLTARPIIGRGKVLKVPASPSAPLSVALAGFSDDHPFTIAPGHWVARGIALPAVGAICAIAFDQQGDAWVVAWEGTDAFTVPPTDGAPNVPSLRTLGTGAQQAAAGTVDAAANIGSVRTLGTGAQQAAAGNDTRIVGAYQAANLSAHDYGERSGLSITGGGAIQVVGSTLKWTARFIVIGAGRGATLVTNGYFDISMPAVGTVITGVGGAANATVNATGIPFAAWDALYYILPIGAGGTFLPANFRMVSYVADIDIPSNWVRIASYNGDDAKMYVAGRGRANDWDYDSGWQPDNNSSGGVRTYFHNLSLQDIPNIFQLYFSAEGTYWYPVGASGMATADVAATTASQYRNPGFTRLSANALEIGVYAAIPLWSSFTGASWVNYASGYWRYRIKK